jgi:Ras-related GTP-binding protein A/B
VRHSHGIVTCVQFTLDTASSNNPASLTARLGATIDVEQNHVRFLGDLVLNLWDCGGQDSFMDTYLTMQRSTIFQQVGVMIYVFDVESRETIKDMEYFRDCMASLNHYSPQAAVFLLVHKMDLVRERQQVFEKKKLELEEISESADISVYGTSIYDESLYKVCFLYSRLRRELNPVSLGMVKCRAYSDT